MPEQKPPLLATVGRYTSMAFLLPSSTVAGYIAGYLLDKFFGTHFLYIVFLVLGIISGFMQLLRQIQRDTRGDS